MASVAEEILREILLTLPTRDVARGRCVSRQWHTLLTDPSFVELHAHSAHIVSGASAEAVLISETQPPGKSPETTVFNASKGNKNHMCCIAGLAPGYSPANVCNGFICLAAAVSHRSRQPVFLCNPITGDTVQVQPPPRSRLTTHWHMYGMGYSPSTRQYKLFRFSFSVYLSLGENVLHVLTLGSGGDGMWRRHQRSFHCHGTGSPPALIDGKLYVLGKERDHDRKPNRLLVVDVASETHHTYHLPKYNAQDAVADVIELRGRPCVAIHELSPWRSPLSFWVILPLAPLSWELRYRFEMGPTAADIIDGHPHRRAAWIDEDDGMLCYLYRDNVYKYDTTQGHQRQHSFAMGYTNEWDCQLHLSPTNDSWWNVFGLFRPNLLSPHDLATAPQQDEERFEHRVVHALRCHKSSKKSGRSPPINDDYERAAKLQSVMPLIDESLRALRK